MPAVVRSVNAGTAGPVPGLKRPSGIHKRPVDVIEVRDPADPRVDDFRALTTADRRPDRPGGRGLVIAEGVLVVRRLLVAAPCLR